MLIKKASNVFSKKQIEQLCLLIDSAEEEIDDTLGRVKKSFPSIPSNIVYKILNLAKNFYGKDAVFNTQLSYVEYSSKYGEPNLPPHLDLDDTEIVIDYQLLSNTTWELGVNMELYKLEDNSALFFNPNKNIHWRPIKKFKNEEYVKMLFFRLSLLDGQNLVSNYTALPVRSEDDPFFSGINKYRNSLAEGF